MVEWRQNFETHLIEGAKTIELTFSEKEMDQLSRYGELLIEWNEKMNLTGITDPQGVAIKHMLDSAVGISLIPQGASLVDVGTGAGFPGIVLKILRPDLEVVLLDSLRKRLNFLDAVIQELGLEKVQTVHARAEEAGHKKNCGNPLISLLHERSLPYRPYLNYVFLWSKKMENLSLGKALKGERKQVTRSERWNYWAAEKLKSLKLPYRVLMNLVY